MMGKDREAGAAEGADLVRAHHDRALAQFLGRFDMDLAPTPENVELVTQQVEVIGRMIDAMHGVGAVERGKRLIWLKAKVEHGAWLPLLERLRLPSRSAQRWMAEARYAMEHGQRRRLAHPDSSGASHFDEAEAAEFDADDLADPSKPLPLSRKQLEVRDQAHRKRDAAKEETILKLQEENVSLKARLAEAEKPEEERDAAADMPAWRKDLIRANFAVGRALASLKETGETDPESVLAASKRRGPLVSYSALHSAVGQIGEILYRYHQEALPGTPWAGPQEATLGDDEEDEDGE